MTATLDTAGMQGLVARAYGHLPVARYFLCGISDPAGAQRWLAGIAGEVATAEERGEGPSVIVAFTYAGLARLGLDDDILATFPRPMQEGMVTEHRSRILGDFGPSDPALWTWGGPSNPDVHLLVVVYAADEPALATVSTDMTARLAEQGILPVVDPIDGYVNDGREHFGFVDGLSQPLIKGWPHRTNSVRPPAPTPPAKWDEVEPGEVVLGYNDNYDRPAEGPTVKAAADRRSTLPDAPWAKGRHHLGHAGTYLVFRQLAQDVGRYRRFVATASEASAVRGERHSPEQVGAKMVGRWASGASLALSPDADPGTAGSNDFGYHDRDQPGFGCPLGAHVRRANPRDSTTVAPPAMALASTKTHRILRRGRPYGLPLVEPPSRPGEEQGAETGLLFLCLNTDIERQFEFVQHTWLQNGYFAGLPR